MYRKEALTRESPVKSHSRFTMINEAPRRLVYYYTIAIMIYLMEGICISKKKKIKTRVTHVPFADLAFGNKKKNTSFSRH